MSDDDTPKLDKSSVVNISGNKFVQYEGLLDYAHQSGMTSLVSKIVHFPFEDSGNMCIAEATATFKDKDGIRTYTSNGSAHAANVRSANMKAYLVEMADTRAKARAMRDGCNIGMVVDVELAGAEVSETQATARGTSATAGKINDGSGACPSCYAPPGKPHTAKCTANGSTKPVEAAPTAKATPNPPAPSKAVETDEEVIARQIGEMQKEIAAHCKLLGKPRYEAGKTPEGWTYGGLWQRWARKEYTAAVTVEEHKVVVHRMNLFYTDVMGDAAGYKTMQEFVNAANAALSLEGDTIGDWTKDEFDAVIVWLKTGQTTRKAA